MAQAPVKFYPQLDALRAFAVVLVIISHWFSHENILNKYSNNGTLGVTLFFVLSGFLITGILLRNKLQIEKGEPLRRAYMIFYIRRSLRIFPVYYLLLLILVVFNIASISKSFWWHFFYVSNFRFWTEGYYEGQLSHFWSLAVEEQFYLLWPAIIFLSPVKILNKIFILGIVLSIVFRYIIVTETNELGRLLMPGSLDSFCIGGLIAYVRECKKSWYFNYKSHGQFFVFLSFVLLIFVHLTFFKTLALKVRTASYFFLISVVFGIWIDRVADGVSNKWTGGLLSNKGLLYIGKISYGIYLFHNFIPFFYGLKIPFISESLTIYVVQCLRLILLIAIASVSWYVLERPVLSLKQKFEF